MNHRKIISLLLAALMLLSAGMTGCSDSAESETGADHTGETASQEPVETESVTGETERSQAKDELPDLDFDGAVVTVCYPNEKYYEQWDIVGTDNSGDAILDEVWNRNRAVEERLGITFNLVPTQGHDLTTLQNEMKNLAFTGSDDYDIVTGTANTIVTQSLYSYMYELSDLKYLDISQPWWRESAIEELALEEGQYRYLMGDHTLNNYLKCGVIYYNKDLYTEGFGDPEDMYQIVLDGAWTYDKMTEMTAAAYIDKNGDGKQNPGDTYGLMVPSGLYECALHMVYGCDLDTYNRTGEGTIDLSPFNNERVFNTIEKINKLCHNTVGVFESNQSIDNSLQYFSDNYALFYTGRLSNAVNATFREMESDYGILTMPKYDEAQEDYISLIHTSTTVTCIPKAVALDKIDMLGAVLESWASEAYRKVLTPFIESAMKAKYSRDELSGQVIDIIFDDPIISFLDMYSSNTGSILYTAVMDNISKGTNTFSSSISSGIRSAQKTIDKYLSKILEADG